ncbi:zinc ribbon domain-containing protein, partial [Lactobacillus porci]|uniref:zinc ribbon domain-containing protein n=1 Tax=Lactobacillus porci TaxID=2012477 RepID=UPI00399165D2
PVAESEAAEAEAPVCPACGAPIKAGDLFCMNCGQKLPESAPAAVPVAPSESTSESSSPAPIAESEAPEAPVCPACGAPIK